MNKNVGINKLIFMLQTHANRYTFHKMQQEMMNDYEKNISATDYIIFAPCKGRFPKALLLNI